MIQQIMVAKASGEIPMTIHKAELQKNIKALSDGKLEHSFNLQAFIILLASAYLFPGVHLASSAEEFRKIENYSLRKEI